jgi:recombination protein RecT
MATSAPARRDNGQAPAPRHDFRSIVEKSADKLRATLPVTLQPQAERFARVALIEFNRNRDLASCDALSVWNAVLQAAEMGLEVGKPHDYAHLVPFSGKCELLIDYKGMLALARRSGHYGLIDTRIVRRGDTFRYAYTPDLDFYHEPCLGPDAGPLTHVYAVAKLTNGERIIEVMTADQVESIRKGSRSANSPAWKNHWDEMARKCPIKRMLKKQERSTELAAAIAHDDRDYDPNRMTVSVAPGAGATASARLASRLAPSLPAPEDISQESPVAPEDVSQDDDGEPWSDEDDGVARDG